MMEDDNAKVPTVYVPPTGRTGAYDVLEDLAAGQFWKAREDVPELLLNGRSRAERQAVKAGAMLMVKELRRVDGDLHAVDLAPHPLEPTWAERRFLVAEFLESFEPVFDAEQVRAAEMAEIQAEMARLQEDMSRPPEAPPQIPKMLSHGLDTTGLAAIAPHAEKTAQVLDQAVEANRRQVAVIQAKSKELAGKAVQLARFYAERSEAAMSGMQKQIESYEQLARGVRSLSLYTGEGIGVFRVMEGPGAAPGEPISVFQRRLFLDEELAVELGSQGLTYKKLDALPGFFARNPGILDRMAPAPRAVVLVSLRRNLPELEGDAGTADIFAYIEEMRENQQSMLLVRDGRNAFFVWSDLIWSYEGAKDDFDKLGLKRLFPSRDDTDAPFRGRFGEDITPRSLDYSDARRRFDDRSLAYKRLVLALAGLQSRERIFGEFEGSDTLNWFAPEFQMNRFRFVTDDENVLEHSRPGVEEYTARMNGALQAGSRVAYIGRDVLTHKSAPTCFRTYETGYGERRHSPTRTAVEPFGVAVARRRGDTTVVEIEVGNWERRSKTLVDLLPRIDSGWGGDPKFLCIDAVELEELEPYVESRRDRQDYLQYLWLFLEVRDLLRSEKKALTPVQEAVAARLTGECQTVEEAMQVAWRAIRLWRAANRWALPKDGAFPAKTMKLIGDVALRLVDPPEKVADAAEALAAGMGREPIRLVLEGNGRLALYATPTDGERIDAFGPHAWPARIQLAYANGMLTAGEPEFVSLLPENIREATLHRWEIEPDWARRKPYDRLTYAKAREIVETAREGARAVMSVVKGDPTWFNHAMAHGIERERGGILKRVDYKTPVGILRLSDTRYGILMANIDPFAVYARAGERCRQDVEDEFRSRYKNPESHVERLASFCKRASRGFTLTVSEANGYDDDGYGSYLWGTYSDEPLEPWRDLVAKQGRVRVGTGFDVRERGATFEECAVMIPDILSEALDLVDAEERAHAEAHAAEKAKEVGTGAIPLDLRPDGGDSQA